ncbi:MAG TPA: hypothetical protein ENJ82_01300 [Bacteroidetes bacterium]|nr:hypothetical protein [Bacteroidota bacterium]
MSKARKKKAEVATSNPETRWRFRLFRRFYVRSRLRWTLVVLFVVAAALILPKEFVREYSFELGKTWVAPSLKADFDFPLLKTQAQLEAEHKSATQSVPLVFVPDSTVANSALRAVAKKFGRMVNDLREYERAAMLDDVAVSSMKEDFLETYKLDPDRELEEHPVPSEWQDRFLRKAELFINRVYETGFLDTAKNELRDQVIYVQTASNVMVQKSLLLEAGELENFLDDEFPTLTQEARVLFRFMVVPRLVPNLSYSAELTMQERDRALKLVSPVFGMVKKGETIISKAERIGETQSQKIRSFLQARDARFGHPPYLVTFAGQLVLVTIITVMLLLFMRNNRPRIYFSNRKLALVFLLFLTMIGVTVLVLRLSLFTQEVEGLHYVFLVPICMVTIILSAFFDSRFAFYGNLIIALFVGSIVPNGFEFFFIQVSAGTAAVYGLTRLRNRADFFIAL